MCKKKDYTKDVYVQPRLTLTNLKIKPCNRLSFHINEVSNVTCGDFQLFENFLSQSDGHVGVSDDRHSPLVQRVVSHNSKCLY